MVSNSISFPIGFVVSDVNLPCVPPFFRVVDHVPTTQLPVLVVGKEKARSEFPDEEIRVLCKILTVERFWTFAPTERYVEYVKDLALFVSHCIEEYSYDFVRYFTEEQLNNGEYDEWREHLKAKYPGYNGEHLREYYASR